MKILFLSRWFPYPMNNGSKIRIYNLLRGVSQHHEVTLLGFADQPGVSPEAPELRSVCSKVQVVPCGSSIPAPSVRVSPSWIRSPTPSWTPFRPKWRGQSRVH